MANSNLEVLTVIFSHKKSRTPTRPKAMSYKSSGGIPWLGFQQALGVGLQPTVAQSTRIILLFYMIKIEYSI